MSEALHEASELGFKRIYLDTLSSSKIAIAFYKKAGFVLTEQYNNNSYADIFMVHDIVKECKEKSMFDNEFCVVEYLNDQNVVYLAWKKYACGSEYRKPTLYALNLLQEHKGSNFIIDARNGFEDDKSDVEWGFAELLPAMGKTSCTTCVMIMNEVNKIEGEMDMWTMEFSKYFKVIHTTTTEAALALIDKK